MRDHDPTEPGELIRYGIIETVDLAARRITVAAGDVVSGPIRWLAPRAGKTRVWSPPSVGEQVVLLCPDGELGAAIALLGVESDANILPGDSEAELVAYVDGAVVGYDPVTHALTAILPDDATARLVAPGGVRLEGRVTITGTLDVSEKLTCAADVVANGVSLHDHVHGLVKAGSDQSGKPA